MFFSASFLVLLSFIFFKITIDDRDKILQSFIMNFLIPLFTFFFFSIPLYASEKILLCKMNYGISGENDETDIEFKNLSIIDQDQVIYLNIDQQWLSVESKKDFIDGGGKYNKTDFVITDSTVFSMSLLQNEGTLIRKNVIELNRYTGFIKHEFRTTNETMYRTGICKLSKKGKLF